MGNQSDWKGFEKMVADALGGKRRNFSQFSSARSKGRGSKVTDIWWPKKVRKEFPFLKRVMVECKKRKSVNVFTEMALAKLKYATKKDSLIVLACKRPIPGRWKRRRNILVKLAKRELGLSREEAKKIIRRDMFIGALVAVELDFFKELWDAWKERKKNETVR